MVLDGLGHTGLSEPRHHDRAVEEARLWFEYDPDVEVVFDFAGVDAGLIRNAVLGRPALYLGEGDSVED